MLLQFRKILLLIISELQMTKFCLIFKIISRRWILSQGNRGCKNQNVRKMTKIMTLVIFEIHKYVHLLKTLFSFLFFIFQLSSFNFHLSTFILQLSTFNLQLSTFTFHLSQTCLCRMSLLWCLRYRSCMNVIAVSFL